MHSQNSSDNQQPGPTARHAHSRTHTTHPQPLELALHVRALIDALGMQLLIVDVLADRKPMHAAHMRTGIRAATSRQTRRTHRASRALFLKSSATLRKTVTVKSANSLSSSIFLRTHEQQQPGEKGLGKQSEMEQRDQRQSARMQTGGHTCIPMPRRSHSHLRNTPLIRSLIHPLTRQTLAHPLVRSPRFTQSHSRQRTLMTAARQSPRAARSARANRAADGCVADKQ